MKTYDKLDVVRCWIVKAWGRFTFSKKNKLKENKKIKNKWERENRESTLFWRLPFGCNKELMFDFKRSMTKMFNSFWIFMNSSSIRQSSSSNAIFKLLFPQYRNQIDSTLLSNENIDSSDLENEVRLEVRVRWKGCRGVDEKSLWTW